MSPILAKLSSITSVLSANLTSLIGGLRGDSVKNVAGTLGSCDLLIFYIADFRTIVDIFNLLGLAMILFIGISISSMSPEIFYSSPSWLLF